MAATKKRKAVEAAPEETPSQRQRRELLALPANTLRALVFNTPKLQLDYDVMFHQKGLLLKNILKKGWLADDWEQQLQPALRRHQEREQQMEVALQQMRDREIRHAEELKNNILEYLKYCAPYCGPLRMPVRSRIFSSDDEYWSLSLVEGQLHGQLHGSGRGGGGAGHSGGGPLQWRDPELEMRDGHMKLRQGHWHMAYLVAEPRSWLESSESASQVACLGLSRVMREAYYLTADVVNHIVMQYLIE